MSSTPPWEQQPDEAQHIYAAARAYFDLGPARSQQAVARQVHKSRSTIARWSARHNWAARARAYDEQRLQMEEARRQGMLETVAQTEARLEQAQARPQGWHMSAPSAARQWGERLRQAREEEWQTTRALLARAREMLACPLEDAKWNWRDAAALIDQAAKLVRQVAGEALDAEVGQAGPGLTVRVEYADDGEVRP